MFLGTLVPKGTSEVRTTCLCCLVVCLLLLVNPSLGFGFLLLVCWPVVHLGTLVPTGTSDVRSLWYLICARVTLLVDFLPIFAGTNTGGGTCLGT
jgi:hypothetical protein